MQIDPDLPVQLHRYSAKHVHRAWTSAQHARETSIDFEGMLMKSSYVLSNHTSVAMTAIHDYGFKLRQLNFDSGAPAGNRYESELLSWGCDADLTTKGTAFWNSKEAHSYPN